MSFRMVKNIGPRSMCDVAVFLKDFPCHSGNAHSHIPDAQKAFVPEIWEDVSLQGQEGIGLAKRYNVTAFLGKDPERTCDSVLRGVLHNGCRSVSFVPVTSYSLMNYAIDAVRKIPADKDMDAVFLVPSPGDVRISEEYSDELRRSVLALRRRLRRDKYGAGRVVFESITEDCVPAVPCQGLPEVPRPVAETFPGLEIEAAAIPLALDDGLRPLKYCNVYYVYCYKSLPAQCCY